MVCYANCDIYFSSSWLVSSAILRVVQDFISSIIRHPSCQLCQFLQNLQGYSISWKKNQDLGKARTSQKSQYWFVLGQVGLRKDHTRVWPYLHAHNSCFSLFKVYAEKIIIIIKHSRQCLIHDIKFANTLKCIKNTLQRIIIATLILAIRNLIKQGLLCLIYLRSLFHLLYFPKSAQNILTNVIYF